MDVRLPNGRILRNVPDDIKQDVLIEQLESIDFNYKDPYVDPTQKAIETPPIDEQEIARVQPQQAAPEEEEESGFLRSYVADPLLSFGQGAIGLGEAAVGLVDVPTFGYFGRGVEAASDAVFGGDLEDASQYLQSLKTTEQLAQEKEVADAKGFTGTLGALFTNPGALTNTILQALPQMLGGAGVARAGLNMAKKRGRKITGKDYLTAASAGEGVVALGAQAESIRKQTEDGLLTPAQAGLALGSGVLTGILGRVGGLAAQKLGVVDIDAALAGQAISEAGQRKVKNSLTQAIRAGIAESAFEELPQSMQEQMVQNIALDRDPMEGVPEAAAEGVAAGFSLAGGITGGRQFVENRKIQEQQEQEDAALAVQKDEDERANTPKDTSKDDYLKDAEARIEERAQMIRDQKKQQKEVDKQKDVKIQESGLNIADLKDVGLDRRNNEYKNLEAVDYTKPEEVDSAIGILEGLKQKDKFKGKDRVKTIDAKINSLKVLKENISKGKTTVSDKSDVLELKNNVKEVPTGEEAPTGEAPSVEKLQEQIEAKEDAIAAIEDEIIAAERNGDTELVVALKEEKGGENQQLAELRNNKIALENLSIDANKILDSANNLKDKDGVEDNKKQIDYDTNVNNFTTAFDETKKTQDKESPPTKAEVTKKKDEPTSIATIVNNKLEIIEGAVKIDKTLGKRVLVSEKSVKGKNPVKTTTVLNNSTQILNPTPEQIKTLRGLSDKIKKRRPLGKEQTETTKPKEARAPESKGYTGETASSIIQKLKDSFGKNIDLGIKRGFINVVNTAQEVPSYISITPNTVAFIEPQTEQVFLIADRIYAEEAPSMLLHEVGAHYGLKRIMGEGNYNRIINSLKAKKDTDKDIKEAFDYVNDLYADKYDPDSDAFVEEVIARIGEKAPKNTLYRQAINFIKNFFRNLGYGWNVDNISAKEIQDMLQYVTRVSLNKPPIIQEVSESNLERDSTIKEAKIDRVKSNVKQEQLLTSKTQKEKRKSLLPPKTQKEIEDITEIYKALKAGKIDYVVTKIFKFDSALSNKLRDRLEAGNVSQNDINDMLYDISSSQTVHASNVTEEVAAEGNLTYNPETYFFSVEPNKGEPSLATFRLLARDFAKEAGVSQNEIEQEAQLAFLATRFFETDKRNKEKIDAMTAIKAKDPKLSNNRDKKQYEKLKSQLIFNHLSEKEMDEGLALAAEKSPKGEFIRESMRQWNEIREFTLGVMTEHELLSKEQAEEYLDAAGYVPAQRVGFDNVDFEASMQMRKDASSNKMKGSIREVNNIYDNIDAWVRNAVRNSIINRNKIAKIRRTIDVSPEIVEEVAGPNIANTKSSAPNIVKVRMNHNGKDRDHYFQFKDPLFAAAFGGLDTIILPGAKYLSRISNVARNTIVLNPLFSISQLVIQDLVSAMFNSGVKNPWMIPLRVIKEIPLSFMDKSKARKFLKGFGAVGYTGTTNLGDPTEAIDLNEPGTFNKIVRGVKKIPGAEKTYRGLEKFAMVSDNVVRQAVYEQIYKESRAAGLSENKSIQKSVQAAFDIINFRMKGSSAILNKLFPVVMFLNAGLRALAIQGSILSGKGITPQQKTEAYGAFVSTLLQVQMAAIAYSLLKGDDEEYKKLDPYERDFQLILNDTYTVPLRPDIYTLLGKVIPEHVVNELKFETQGDVKTWEAMKRSLGHILQVNAVPTAIKPFVEVATNQTIGPVKRSIIPRKLEEQQGADQWSQYTSETSKIISKQAQELGILDFSPIVMDHLIRQLTGYAGATALYLTDEILFQNGVSTRPERSMQDQFASFPGISRFVQRGTDGKRSLSDLYELDRYTSRFAAQYASKLKNQGASEELNLFLNQNQAAITVQKYITRRKLLLSKIANAERKILESSTMTPENKRIELEALNKQRRNILSDVNRVKRETEQSLKRSRSKYKD